MSPWNSWKCEICGANITYMIQFSETRVWRSSYGKWMDGGDEASSRLKFQVYQMNYCSFVWLFGLEHFLEGLVMSCLDFLTVHDVSWTSSGHYRNVMMERWHEISKLTIKTDKLNWIQYIHSSALSRFCVGVLVLGDRSTGMPLGLTGDRSRIMVDSLESPS